jgi:hypothetical protein
MVMNRRQPPVCILAPLAAVPRHSRPYLTATDSPWPMDSSVSGAHRLSSACVFGPFSARCSLLFLLFFFLFPLILQRRQSLISSSSLSLPPLVFPLYFSFHSFLARLFGFFRSSTSHPGPQGGQRVAEGKVCLPPCHRSPFGFSFFVRPRRCKGRRPERNIGAK